MIVIDHGERYGIMSYRFQFYIAVFSPAISLRLFDEVVHRLGRDSYEISRSDGAYVLRSEYISEREGAIIQASTGLNLRTSVSCWVLRPAEVNVDDMLIRLIDRTVYEISHDFLLVENYQNIIILRKNYDIIVTPLMDRLAYQIHDRSYEVQELPRLDVSE